jgi:hypothetical protein
MYMEKNSIFEGNMRTLKYMPVRYISCVYTHSHYCILIREYTHSCIPTHSILHTFPTALKYDVGACTHVHMCTHVCAYTCVYDSKQWALVHHRNIHIHTCAVYIASTLNSAHTHQIIHTQMHACMRIHIHTYACAVIWTCRPRRSRSRLHHIHIEYQCLHIRGTSICVYVCVCV